MAMSRIFSLTLALILSAALGLTLSAQQTAGPGEPSSANGTSGGAIKYTRSIAENSPTSIAEAADYVLLKGPAAGSEARFTIDLNAGPVNDDWILHFSGECRLIGSDENSDWVDLQIRFDGMAVQPLNGGSPLGFCSDDNYEAHSIIAMVEHVPTGPHTVEVYWKLRDSAPSGTLTGWIDDWTFLAMVSE